MLITISNIREVKSIALNVDDSRIEPYIEEAELLYVIPAIGAELYQQLNDSILQDNSGNPIDINNSQTFSQDEISDLMNGCYWDKNIGGEKVKQYCTGLKKAISYLTYSRFIRNQNVNVSPFGVTFKTSLDSEKVDDKILMSISKESEKIGQEFLQQCVDFLNKDSYVIKNVSGTKFKSIGD